MRVVQLATYPIVNPMHGGQIRASQIANVLRGMGCQVRSLSISPPAYEHFHPENDLIISLDDQPHPYETPHGAELQVARLAAHDERILGFLRQHFAAFSPEVIFVEQMWLWPAVQTLIREGVLDAKRLRVVYSSHNVESAIKADILRNHGSSDAAIKGFSEEVAELEASLTQAATDVICVTSADAAHFAPMARREVLVCPNGVAPRVLDSRAMNDVVSFTRGRPYVLFAGSAHPPNAEGFWRMLGPSLAHIPPDACIVVVGSVGAILHRYAPPDARVYSLVNASVVQCVGQVPDATLSALIWGARAMIVPIVSGGGSNLKTAEAIASFRPVIATSFACRGYEFARSLQSFFVRDDPADFSAAVDRILSEDLQDVACSESERAVRESVFWERTLSPMRRVLM